VRLAAVAQAPVEAVEAVLGAPGDLQDVIGLAGLAVGQCGADPRLAGVVPGRFDQQPPCVGGAGLGDRALDRGLAGLLERGRQAQPGEQPSRRSEALPVAAEFEMDRECGQRVEPAEGAQARDRGPQPLVLGESRESLVERVLAREAVRSSVCEAVAAC
jgi:hypothetical protein